MIVLRGNANRLQPCLENGQQLQAADRSESDTVDNNALAAMNHCDVIPQLQMRHNGQQRFRIIRAEKLQCPVGENDAESEGGISRVLFENRDLDFGAAFFYTVGAVKAGRSGSGDYDPHAQLTFGCCRPSYSFADVICRRGFLWSWPKFCRRKSTHS